MSVVILFVIVLVFGLLIDFYSCQLGRPRYFLCNSLSKLLVLLERNRLLSLSMSSKSCARGVALSRLYLTGFTSVEIGGR